MSKVQRVLAILLLVCTQQKVYAVDLDAVTPRFGVLYISNAQGTGAASPFLSTFGCSFDLDMGWDDWSLYPGVDLFWTQYEWDSSLERALPTEPETLQSSFVFALLLDAIFSYRLDLTDKLALLPGVGPALLLRAAFPGSDSMPASDNLSIFGYFYNGARFLYPEVQALLTYRLQDRFIFEFSIRSYWPLFNLWTQAPFFDNWMLGVALSMRIGLR